MTVDIPLLLYKDSVLHVLSPVSHGTNKVNLSKQCLEVAAFHSHCLHSTHTIRASTAKLRVSGFK